MKRFLPLRHYSCAPTTQGHLLDSFRWVEGARGQAGNCGHQFWHMPPFRLDGSPSSVRAVLGRVGATAIRAGHGFSRNSPNDIWGFNPEARRPAKRFRFRFPLAAYAVPRAILLTRPLSANLPSEGTCVGDRFGLRGRLSVSLGCFYQLEGDLSQSGISGK